MNRPEENDVPDIKYTANGDIDVNYYMHRAETLRGEYVAGLFAAAGKGIKKIWHAIIDKLAGLNWQPSH